MNARIKRILSFVLASIMLLGSLSLPAFADTNDSGEVPADTLTTGAANDDIYRIKYNKEQLEKLIGVDSYYAYRELNKKKPLGKTTLKFSAVDLYRAAQEAYAAGEDIPETTVADEIKIVDASTINSYAGILYDNCETIDGNKVEELPTGEVLVTPDHGETVLLFEVPKGMAGNYAVRFTYISTEQTDAEEESAMNMKDTSVPTTIERMMYLNDKLPFAETKYLYFPRAWEYEYDAIPNADTLNNNFGIDTSKYKVNDEGIITNPDDALLEALGFDPEIYDIITTEKDVKGETVIVNKIYDTEYGCYTFPKDKNGNDTRPRRWEVPAWQTYYVRDWLGYEIDPFQFYLEEGKNTMTLVANREGMILHSIEFYPYEEEMEYDDWYKYMTEEKGVKEITDCESIKVQAENPTYTSVQNIIPSNDRTSSITEPQDPACIKYNILDTGNANNWMKYKVTVPKSGLYSISFRFRQNSLIGMFTSRRVKINNEVQFREASYLRFMYNTEFQSTFATDGKRNFLFYLNEGENVIEIEAVLGEMVEYVYEIEQLIEKLNDTYQRMLKITGPIPDTYRDYGFYQLVPEDIKTIANAANQLYAMEKSIVKMTGEEGDQSNTLLTIAELLDKMASDEYEIAPNFLTFKNYIISLSDWLYAALGQPLKLDFFVIGPANLAKNELPQATATVWQTIKFECSAFVASFTMDYTTIGFRDDSATMGKKDYELEMWAIADRESMLITRYLVDNYFSAPGMEGEGIKLRIKVITAGLTEAILAGIGPDISFLDTVNTVTFGMRTALEPLEDMDGFDVICSQYPQGLVDKMGMYTEDSGGKYHYYGLPTTLVVPITFYRLDVLSELGLEPPETWSALKSAMPALLSNNLEVGLPNGLVGTQMMLYQRDGLDMYKNEGRQINLDDPEALAAFKDLCELFQKYNCPVAYDITRFRTGEIPIMVAEDGITTYNQLMTFYELRGLWQMEPVIGTLDENGNINRTAVANTQAMIMPADGDHTDDDKASIWRFMKWYCGEESQRRQAREAIAVSQPTNKFSTANREALLSQKWTEQEKSAITEIWDNVTAVREYPGSYIVPQYAQFAFLAAYNEGANPADAMLEQINYINKEITRKRQEFGLDYIEVGASD